MYKYIEKERTAADVVINDQRQRNKLEQEKSRLPIQYNYGVKNTERIRIETEVGKNVSIKTTAETKAEAKVLRHGRGRRRS